MQTKFAPLQPHPSANPAGAGRFAGKVAAITGGTSGIGLATVRRLHSEGASVVLAARHAARGEAVTSELGPERAIFCPTDVVDRKQLDALFSATVERFGRLDILVNNAGATGIGEIATLKSEHWHRLININLHALFEACQSAIPHLRAARAADAQSCPAIVNITSIAGTAGDSGMLAYNAAKAGALNFTRSLALELAPEGIRVNAISPGAVDTPLSADATGNARVNAAFNAAIPLGRFGQPEEIASAIAFLAADEASFITGANLLVDGGVSASTGHPNLLRLFNEG